MIRCLICSKELKYISNTHLKKHNITIKEYKQLYPLAKIRCDEYESILSEIRNNICPKKMREGVKLAEAKDPDYHKKRISKTQLTIKEKRKNDKEYNERYKNKRMDSQLKRWENATEDEIRKFKNNLSNIVKERFKKWKTTEIDKMENFKNVISKASIKAWSKKTPEQKREIYTKFKGNCKDIYELDTIKFRNWFEYFTAMQLKKYLIDFKYEGITIPLNNKNIYIPDFYIEKYNLIIETKGRTVEKPEISYMKQKASLAIGYNHEFIWYERDQFLIEKQIENVLHKYNII